MAASDDRLIAATEAFTACANAIADAQMEVDQARLLLENKQNHLTVAKERLEGARGRLFDAVQAAWDADQASARELADVIADAMR